MYYEPDSTSLGSAIADFRRARNQAELRELIARLRGNSIELLSFDKVRKQLKLKGGIPRGIKEIPLDSIVGSVGRYSDFTRDFLPLREANMDRWARVKVATNGMAGLPPIDVYQIGEVYFVLDGNHRISVARQHGAEYIQAYVTEIQSRVPLTPDVQPDDLIVMTEYVNFLEKTQIDKIRPDANLKVTIPGQYGVLLEHIDVHRYFMGLDSRREIPYREAVAHWYDTVYLPIIETIRKQGILRHFPERTETDMYLWIAERRAQLEEELGRQIRTEYAARDLISHFAPRLENLIVRFSRKLLDIIVPDKLEEGPPTGEWRKIAAPSQQTDSLFLDILVPVNGREDGWCALEQALVIAQQEGSRLHGLHVVPRKKDKVKITVTEIQEKFNQRCNQVGIIGQLYITTGRVADQICEHAHWTDLVVVNLTYPPAPRPLAKLSSGFRDLIRFCPRPILATPHAISQLNRALLAYDGSPKAREALFVATHLACKEKIFLVVVSVAEKEQVTEETLKEARSYLETQNVEALYLNRSGSISEAILESSIEYDCDLLIMGGYGYSSVLEVVLGSAVDRVLRESHKPMLICR
jgi:nucleotide-binding universal stress UspA family protein